MKLDLGSGPSVHILWHRSVLCGSLHGEPRSWAHAARWIGANDPGWREHATCATCREQAKLHELLAERERAYAAGIFIRPDGMQSLASTWVDTLAPSVTLDGTWTEAR